MRESCILPCVSSMLASSVAVSCSRHGAMSRLQHPGPGLQGWLGCTCWHVHGQPGLKRAPSKTRAPGDTCMWQRPARVQAWFLTVACTARDARLPRQWLRRPGSL